MFTYSPPLHSLAPASPWTSRPCRSIDRPVDCWIRAIMLAVATQLECTESAWLQNPIQSAGRDVSGSTLDLPETQIKVFTVYIATAQRTNEVLCTLALLSLEVHTATAFLCRCTNTTPSLSTAKSRHKSRTELRSSPPTSIPTSPCNRSPRSKFTLLP
jgi:hypothetical protein